jgi:lipoprotein-anchoring transpeptidase ErfK/SrfK
MFMQRHMITALVLSAIGIVSASAEPMSLQPDRFGRISAQPATPAYIAPPVARTPVAAEPVPAVRYAAANPEPNLGGGFIEFLFSGGPLAPPRPPSEVMARRELYDSPPQAAIEPYAERRQAAIEPARGASEPARASIDRKYLKQVVAYPGPEKPGTIIIDTPNRFLYFVQDNGTAVRYGIGVGRPGFTWAGVKSVSAKKEWPDWTPPPEMLQRRPDLPHFMAGGPENPLGARALYLGSSLYRIHGSNEPWTIGQAVSSGCIRMRNEDVIDLYSRVNIGTKVVVI